MKLQEKEVGMPFVYAVYHEGKNPIYQSEEFNEYESYKYYRSILLPGGVFNKPTLISYLFSPGKKALCKINGNYGGLPPY